MIKQCWEKHVSCLKLYFTAVKIGVISVFFVFNSIHQDCFLSLPHKKTEMTYNSNIVSVSWFYWTCSKHLWSHMISVGTRYHCSTTLKKKKLSGCATINNLILTHSKKECHDFRDFKLSKISLNYLKIWRLL